MILADQSESLLFFFEGLEEHCRRLGEEELTSLNSAEKKEMRNTLKVSGLLRKCSKYLMHLQKSIRDPSLCHVRKFNSCETSCCPVGSFAFQS